MHAMQNGHFLGSTSFNSMQINKRTLITSILCGSTGMWHNPRIVRVSIDYQAILEISIIQ